MLRSLFVFIFFCFVLKINWNHFVNAITFDLAQSDRFKQGGGNVITIAFCVPLIGVLFNIFYQYLFQLIIEGEEKSLKSFTEEPAKDEIARILIIYE